MKRYFFFVTILFVCLLSLTSCKDDDAPQAKYTRNYDGFSESVVEDGLTPTAVTIKMKGQFENSFVFVAENREILEKLMKDPAAMDAERFNCVKRTRLAQYGSYVTFYNLTPATTYYYFVFYKYMYSDGGLIGLINSFTTEDINLICDLGGSVKWCGVNYSENRGEFDASQLFESSVFAYNELPDPKLETLEGGSWRYPTLQELQELCDNCKVTMIDFLKKYVKITAANGNSIYVPFTLTYPNEANFSKMELMLFPSDESEYGIFVRVHPHYNMSHESFGHPVKFDNMASPPELHIAHPDRYSGYHTDFFWWAMTFVNDNGTERTLHGNVKRGVRFVLDK